MVSSPHRPVGVVTRGTTNPNRLRRIDRWLAGPQARRLRLAADPLVVDVGFGRSGVTSVELFRRLRAVRADVEVVGVEIDPERVALAAGLAEPGLSFRVGGFELGGVAGLAGRRPVIVRAANVLRQYDEGEVAGAWSTMATAMAPGGLIVDATCDEVGRRAAWLAVGVPGGPERASSHGAVKPVVPQVISLTLSMRLGGLERPSQVAERLPKSLIHRNVPGEPLHEWLSALDLAWARAAPHTPYGARQRFVAAVRAAQAAGWPVQDGPARWRLGEVTLPWPP